MDFFTIVLIFSKAKLIISKSKCPRLFCAGNSEIIWLAVVIASFGNKKVIKGDSSFVSEASLLHT